MTLDELLSPGIISESKKKVWTRKNGTLENRTKKEEPSKGAVFDDSRFKTQIRIKKNGK